MGGDDAPGAVPVVEEQSVKEVLVYLASEDFGRQPLAVRGDYLRRVKEAEHIRREYSEGKLNELSIEQRKRLGRNMADVQGAEWDKRINRYFALPEKGRAAYIDEMIDAKQRKEATAHGKPRTSEPDRKPDEDDKKHGKGSLVDIIRKDIETSDPAERARRMEFKRAFLERMRERGIATP